MPRLNNKNLNSFIKRYNPSMKNSLYLFLLTLIACSPLPEAKKSSKTSIRFASYNVALYRGEEGILARDLSTGKDTQMLNIATVIREVRPDVLALMEFDENDGNLLADFQKNYLTNINIEQAEIAYPYQYSVPSNTGVLSGHDYNNDGKVALPVDGFGFGVYPGQYAFALLSKYPIDKENIRSFQKLLWKDMPNAKQPMNPDGTAYYEKEEWESFRLSSKNHVDIPIKISKKKTVHVILAHPTPPVFDGPEDRNGLRNYDEIRLLKDYISNADYLVDDNGRKGGLEAGASFVIMGDLNADPIDGDSYPGAIYQLLDHSAINQDPISGNYIPKSNGGKAHNRSKDDKGDPAYDTSFFGKRIDYVLPSKDFKVKNSGVFWPAPGEPLYYKVRDKKASDHLMVWMEVE